MHTGSSEVCNSYIFEYISCRISALAQGSGAAEHRTELVEQLLASMSSTQLGNVGRGSRLPFTRAYVLT